MLKYNKHIITLLMVLIMPALVSGCVVKPSDDYNLTEDKTTASSHRGNYRSDHRGNHRSNHRSNH